MKRFLLDTGIMGDFINRRRGVDGRVDEARMRGDRVGTCWPVIGELWFGVERSVTRELNRERLVRGLARIPKWPFEDESAQHFGRIRNELRRSGRVMSVVDMQLAAIAFALGNCTVVSKDGDLSAVPGLQVENWATACAIGIVSFADRPWCRGATGCASWPGGVREFFPLSENAATSSSPSPCRIISVARTNEAQVRRVW